MAGWGRCRRCREPIWWGTSPYAPDKAFPYDDKDEEQSHFETCAAQEYATDDNGFRHQVSACKTCGAKVWWDVTFRGKRRPMDVEGAEGDWEATWECHFDSCVGHMPGVEPETETVTNGKRQEHEDRAASAPYAYRLWLPDLELGWPLPEPRLAVITSAFRRLCLIHHPDVGGTNAGFIRIKQAFDELKKLEATHAH